MEQQYFSEQMKSLLGARYNEFVGAYENKPRHKAARVNTLKIETEEFLRLIGGEHRRNALCAQSFYTDVKPSLDPLYHAGLYYMQEPSAAAAVAAFAPFIGERVLDLCAAPGGKSTQAAAVMNGHGVIFCNDVEYKRVTALIENIERLGIKNAVVTCATAADYRAAGFDGYFDTIIIDAPCSGGGMMRYESVPYSAEIVAGCAKRQREILDNAAELLCRGGYILYSTCTFSREEDEDNIEYLAGKGFEPIDIPLRDGEERGIGIPEARRIYPMNFDGEGHFYCVLKKPFGADKAVLPAEKVKRAVIGIGECGVECFSRGDNFVLGELCVPRIACASDCNRAIRRAPFRYLKVGAHVYTDAYTVGKPREFSHALTHALSREQADAVGTVELGASAADYIRGAQLSQSGRGKGMKIATVSGYALGWAKAADDGAGTTVLKNLYPKMLRI